MKKILTLVLLSISMFAICQQKAQAGILYTNTTVPVAGQCYNNNEKMGVSESMNILGLVTTGDAGVKAAAQDAGIKKINYIEQHVKSVFIFFKKRTTKVYGY